MEKEAKVNAKDQDGWTPLHWAVRNGHIDTVKTLIEKRAD
ncbi:ankyrin repeat domain-containing protein [Wolbachia endosymbiont (group A) of Barypeithes pellucidus]